MGRPSIEERMQVLGEKIGTHFRASQCVFGEINETQQVRLNAVPMLCRSSLAQQGGVPVDTHRNGFVVTFLELRVGTVA